MVALKNLLFYAVAATALSTNGDAYQVANDLVDVNNQIKLLYMAITNYTGGIPAALPIQSAFLNLDGAIKDTVGHVTDSVISEECIEIIGDYIVDILEPNISDTVMALITKKNEIQTDSLNPIVKEALGKLKDDTDLLGRVLVAKGTGHECDLVREGFKEMDWKLMAAFTCFS